MSLQIGYVIYLANATSKTNIIHWFLIKCKRVIRSVLAAELYGTVNRFDIRVVIKAILGKMLGSAILLVLCTNLKSLYDCLVKIGTTQEKQLMVDVMSLCQLYKQQEITEIRWIHGYYIPADSITKAKLLSALKILINTNCINIKTTKWVEWASLKQANTDI